MKNVFVLSSKRYIQIELVTTNKYNMKVQPLY